MALASISHYQYQHLHDRLCSQEWLLPVSLSPGRAIAAPTPSRRLQDLQVGLVQALTITALAWGPSACAILWAP